MADKELDIDEHLGPPSRYLPAFTRAANKGYTYGYSAEAEAAARAAKGEPYAANFARLRGEEASLQKQHPYVTMAGETLGTLLNPLTYAGAGIAAKFGRPVQMVGNAANQAIIGGAEAYSRKHDVGDIGPGATTGALFSLGADSVASLISKVGDKAARAEVYSSISKLLKEQPIGWDKTLRKVFNAGPEVSEEAISKHAADYAYRIKNDKNASLVENVAPPKAGEIPKAPPAKPTERVEPTFPTEPPDFRVKPQTQEAGAGRGYGQTAGPTISPKGKLQFRTQEDFDAWKAAHAPKATEKPQTPKDKIALEEGDMFTKMADPAKYDQLRRERMYADIAALPREQRNSVEVMDKLAQKHGFDDHIDWARFNQGIEKQDPLATVQARNAPSGSPDTMAMAGKTFEEGGGDDIITAMKDPALYAARQASSKLQKLKNVVSDAGEYIPGYNVVRIPSNTSATGYGRVGLDDPRFAEKLKEIGMTPEQYAAAYKDAEKAYLSAHTDYVTSRGPNGEPPNTKTMGMASMPIEQRVEPTFEVPGQGQPQPQVTGVPSNVPAASMPNTTGWRDLFKPRASRIPEPPQPASTASSVLENLSPDYGVEALKGVLKAGAGTAVGYGVQQVLPKDWQQYSWMLPYALGIGAGGKSFARSAGNFAESAAMNRAVKYGSEPMNMVVPVTAATSIANQGISGPNPNEIDIDQLLGAPTPQSTGKPLVDLANRFKDQWATTGPGD